MAKRSSAPASAAQERGYDGAERAQGRKRHVLVDPVGLILLACVHAADLHDRAGGQWSAPGFTGQSLGWVKH